MICTLPLQPVLGGTDNCWQTRDLYRHPADEEGVRADARELRVLSPKRSIPRDSYTVERIRVPHVTERAIEFVRAFCLDLYGRPLSDNQVDYPAAGGIADWKSDRVLRVRANVVREAKSEHGVAEIAAISERGDYLSKNLVTMRTVENLHGCAISEKITKVARQP